MWDGEHTIWPCSLGGYKENISFPKDTALLKENRLGLIGDASMDLDSLVFIEMIGFWNNRGQMVVFTIRVKVDIITIIGQSGIQDALTHRALWQWLIGHRARRCTTNQDVTWLVWLRPSSLRDLSLQLPCPRIGLWLLQMSLQRSSPGIEATETVNPLSAR